MRMLPGGVHNQVVGINGTDAGGEVPAGDCVIGRRIRAFGRSQYAIRSGWLVTVVSPCTNHIRIAICDIVKYARGADLVPIGGIARGTARRPVLGGGNLV